jgi:hypothetical protein
MTFGFWTPGPLGGNPDQMACKGGSGPIAIIKGANSCRRSTDRKARAAAAEENGAAKGALIEGPCSRSWG